MNTTIVVHKHWTILLPPILVILFGLLCIVADMGEGYLIVGIIFFVVRLIPFLTCKLVLQDGIMTGKDGFIRSFDLKTSINNVVDIGIGNGLFGKLFRYCNLIVSTKGTGSVEYKFRGMKIEEAKNFRDAILAYQTQQ